MNTFMIPDLVKLCLHFIPLKERIMWGLYQSENIDPNEGLCCAADNDHNAPKKYHWVCQYDMRLMTHYWKNGLWIESFHLVSVDVERVAYQDLQTVFPHSLTHLMINYL